MTAWKGLVASVAGLVGLALAPLSHAQAPAAPILEAPAILGLPEASQASVRRFLNLNTPRVLAFGPNGTFGWQAGGGDAAFVEQTALSNCERRAGPGACTIAVRDLSIVKPGREWAPNPPPAGVAITSATYLVHRSDLIKNLTNYTFASTYLPTPTRDLGWDWMGHWLVRA